MRCHYEVIGVARDATVDEIKKQYKRLALQWHPDRNIGNEHEATAAFKEISTAYTVLSDPHERQWYDDHRESILRGGNGTSEDDEEGGGLFNIWRFFNTSCFSGFDDDEYGFFAVYEAVFHSLVEQESEKAGSRKTSKYPKFGMSSSSNEDVLYFYAQWENYVSEMTFAWADKYNVLEAPNRQVKRAIEKENSKSRDSARKEWIANVRSLVSFVKKRDPRFIAIETEKANRKKEEESRKAAQKAEEQRRRKELREQYRNNFVEDEEERERRLEERKGAFLLADNDDSDEDERKEVNGFVEDVAEELEELAMGLSSSGRTREGSQANVDEEISNNNEEEVDDTTGTEGGGSGGFGCILCNKRFKSEAQLLQHNNSKVHRKKVTESQRKTKSK